MVILENDNKETCQTNHLAGEITMIDVLAKIFILKNHSHDD